MSGVIGRTEADVQAFVAANKLEPDTIDKLISDGHVKKGDNIFIASDEFQDIYILENRIIDLTPMAKKALSLISASGSMGILQTDLAKALNVDNKTLFHHMKPLVKYDLITRHPVASKKTFTYLCTLSKFFIEDSSDMTAEKPTMSLKLSSIVYKDAVVRLLSDSKGKTFTTRQLYEECCPEGTDAKDFRRCLLALEHEGVIEILSTRELGGTSRLVRLSSKSTKDDEPLEEEEEEQLMQYSAPLWVPFVPIEKQVRDFIADCGDQGATMNDIIKSFGLRKKFAFRLMERLVDKKSILNTDVSRQAEFAGRERRYKFTISDNSVGSRTENGNKEMTRDSVNRVKRQQEILRLLNEKQIVEINRSMADLIAVRLGSSKHIVDVKTLKRTVNLMKENGQLEVHSVRSINYGDRMTNRVVITLPGIKGDSQEFEKLLLSLDGKKEQNVQPTNVEFVEVNKYDFGFIFGFMERLRLCHEYLYEKRVSERTIVFNTTSLFFKDISLLLFHQIIGCNVKMSMEYYNLSKNHSNTSIKDLPIAIHREVNLRLKVHKKVIHGLVNVMLELGLIEEHHEEGFVETTKVPFQVLFCDTIKLKDPFGNNCSEYKLQSMEDVNRYWNSFFELARVPEELNMEKGEVYDIRNWSNRPINTTMIKLIDREAERIVDSADDNQTFLESIERLSQKLGLTERVVSCYLEYFVSLMQPESLDADDSEQQHTDTTKTLKQRRRRQDGLNTEESLKLKLLMTVIELEEITFTADQPFWTTISQQVPFEQRTADDLRRKFANIQKSISETAALKNIKTKCNRIKQLEQLGVIPKKNIGMIAENLQDLYNWYRLYFDQLDQLEESLVEKQPRTLHEAKTRRWIELAVFEREQGHCLSGTPELDQLRKALLYSSVPITTKDENMIKLIEYGFAQQSNENFKLSNKVKEWLQLQPDHIPTVLVDGLPLSQENTAEADIYQIYRLYGSGSIKFSKDSKSDLINYTLTIHKPSCQSAESEDNKEYLWFDLDCRFQESIFYKCIQHVLDQICKRPGATLQSNILTAEEVDYLVDYLQSHEYIKSVQGRLLPIL